LSLRAVYASGSEWIASTIAKNAMNGGG